MKTKNFILLAVTMLFCTAFSSCSKDQNTLPTLLIKSDSQIKWDDRIGCLIYNITDCDTICWSGNIKYRGGISTKYPKHSYSLKLDKDYSVAGLPKGKSWILNASYIDKTFIRHKLCYDLFKNMGEYNIAPQCAYAVVNENGNPQGLYVVMQRLTKKVLQIDDSDDNALIFKEPKLFFADSLMPAKQYPNENYNEQTYPDFDKFGDKSAILDEFHKFILESSDEDFKSKINDWIDLRNVVDWHLLLLFTNNSDGVLKNFYLYKIDSETPFRIAIWDCDHGLGRDGDNENNMLERLTNDQRNILFNRLLITPWYQEMMSERWIQLRDNDVISYRTLKDMIGENDKLVRKGLLVNQSIWSYDSEFYYDDNNYEQEIDLMLDFIQLSLDTMDKRFGYQ